MTNPTPQVVQRFIAERLGWTDLKRSPIDNRLWGLPPQDTVAELDLGKYMLVPNWPGSHDAARRLEVKDKSRFALCLFEIAFGEENSDDPTLMVTGEVGQLLFATSDQWCLAWILYKGYKWTECVGCRMSGASNLPRNKREHCEVCSGNGGEFVRV